VNKAAESQLAREDVLDDSELDDGFDNNMVTQSVQPHKSSLGMQNWIAVKRWEIKCGCFCFDNYIDANNVKEECDKSDMKSESNPAITAEGGVTAAIKQKTKVNIHNNETISFI
jgi:DNA-directed RNA polymerase III subunit RPC4